MRKGKLTDEARTYAVQALACFDTPSEVAEAIRKEFNLDIAVQSVEAYDPTKRAGANLSKRWTKLFETTRETFLEKTANVPASHRAVRVKRLERMAAKAEAMKNYALAGQLLEQIAKEMGDSYTNKRQISGPGGKPIQTETTVTLDERSAELARRFLE